MFYRKLCNVLSSMTCKERNDDLEHQKNFLLMNNMAMQISHYILKPYFDNIIINGMLYPMFFLKSN